MSQYDLGSAGLRQSYGELGGDLVAEVALGTQDTLLQVIGIGAAAEGFHIVVGLQHRQVHAGQEFRRLVGDIAGVRQDANTAVGGIHPAAAGAGGVMGGGKSGDGAAADLRGLTGAEFPAPVLNTGQPIT